MFEKLKKPVPAFSSYFIGYNYGVEDCQTEMKTKFKEIEKLKINVGCKNCIENSKCITGVNEYCNKNSINSTIDKILSML